MESTDSFRPSHQSDEKLQPYHRSRAGNGAASGTSNKKKAWIIAPIVILIILIVVLVPVGVHIAKSNNKNSPSSGSQASSSSSAAPTATSLPGSAGNTTVSTNSSTPARANANVPPIDQAFPYGSQPIRGVNIGGWLVTEPFITPSLYDQYAPDLGIVDEWTLSTYLGANASTVLEDHYKTFVTEATFQKIASLGLDHVRIGWGYWALGIEPGDPFVNGTSWNYLVQGVRWAAKYGLRVNLDYHAAPGSQNGWNHSGRQGIVGWLNGTASGTLFAQRSLQDHAYAAKFFSQPEFQNVVTMYGVVNEPNMMTLDPQAVITWSGQAYQTIRQAGFNGTIIIGDGFYGVPNWKGQLTVQEGFPGMALDVHDYVIFNNGQIKELHDAKLSFSCTGWMPQVQTSNVNTTGFGPTLIGEWSIADTDCAMYLNQVGLGARWDGHFDSSGPQCPTGQNCDCNTANTTSLWSDAYKTFLLANGELQMSAYEAGWGWFYWNFDTETATQWSYFKSVDAGVLPQSPYNRQYSCPSTIPDVAAMGLPENY